MQVGSLVEYIGGELNESDKEAVRRGVIIPSVNVTYTVRDLFKERNGAWIRLEEIINPIVADKISDKFSHFFSQNIYDYKEHVATANELDNAGKLPATFEMLKVPARTEYVWDDVVRMRTLNSNQSQNKEQNHICPLQFDIVERLINRYSNKGDLIFDPFAGLFTVPYCAINMDRKGYGTELNSEYFGYGVRYLKEAEYKKNIPTLFDLIQEAI